MRFYRNAIIMVVAAAVLVGAYFILNATIGKKDANSENAQNMIEVVKLDVEKIKELSVNNNEGDFKFKYNEGNWDVEYKHPFKADKIQVDSIVANIADLKAEKIIEENAPDLSKYGLDKPTTVSVRTEDGTETAIEVGNITATSESYYIKKKGEKTVYIIQEYIGRTLKVTKNDVREKLIFDVLSSDVTEFAVTRDSKAVFRINRLGEMSWAMVEPVDAKPNMEQTDMAIDNFIRAEIQQFVEDGAQDLSKYGLDNPKYTISAVSKKGEKVKVLLGSIQGLEIYAMLEGTKDVFTFASSNLDFIDRPTVEFVVNTVYMQSIDDVSKLDLNIDGKTISSTIEINTEDNSKTKYTIDGKDISAKGEEAVSAFKSYYNSIISIPIHELNPEATPTGEAEITINYELKVAPGKVTLGFVAKDSETYYVVKNGKFSGLIVEKKVFDMENGIRKAYAKLADTLAK